MSPRSRFTLVARAWQSRRPSKHKQLGSLTTEAACDVSLPSLPMAQHSHLVWREIHRLAQLLQMVEPFLIGRAIIIKEVQVKINLAVDLDSKLKWRKVAATEHPRTVDAAQTMLALRKSLCAKPMPWRAYTPATICENTDHLTLKVES